MLCAVCCVLCVVCCVLCAVSYVTCCGVLLLSLTSLSFLPPSSFLLHPSSFILPTYFCGRQTGHIEINGVGGSTLSAVEFTGLVGFVPQEDIMMRMLTVKENLTLSGGKRENTRRTYCVLCAVCCVLCAMCCEL